MVDAEPYAFASEPRAVPGSRQKYRYGDDGLNIMADPRVVRGNTYSGGFRGATPGSAAIAMSQTGPASIASAPRAKRKLHGVTRPKGSIFEYEVPARQSAAVDLSAYLVEQTAPPPTANCSTQTDAFAPLPAPEPYIPAKTGVDLGTQIIAEDGLFDFDSETAPLLEVLVAKTVEQALTELQHAAELDNINAQMRDFQRRCAEEAASVKEQEEAIKARAAAKADALDKRKTGAERRRDQAEQLALATSEWRVMRENEAHEAYLASLVDPVAEEVKATFIPYVVNGVVAQCDTMASSDEVLDAAMAEALAKGEAASAEKCGEMREAKAAAEELERRRKRKGNITLSVAGAALGLPPVEAEEGEEGPDPNVVAIGPMAIGGLETLTEVESRIRDWLAANREGAEWPGGLLSAALGVDLGPDDVLLDAQLPENGQIIVNSLALKSDAEEAAPEAAEEEA
eukprot:CAMPEP_0118853520 /NCGR_PEP_ID=MMETSP1163-20130328/2068_1 /TAXON_ID=124430 /ORGANISM="Phaeomonas parva, Strain CCMP2877" /LENGTH=455 /DNA_ID=CAMNT_0006786079 /DNA_START=71 /DNA_END=1438 /DNA_ORIENTATION=-